MAVNPKISEFVERARGSGTSEQSIVGILTARGWPEKEVYEALAAQYERLTGIEIPRRGSAGTAAKDAFFYLLVFSTLATWTCGLGWLAFTLIDHWFEDLLFPNGYYPQMESYSIASALATILVAFPVYLLVSRAIVSEERKHPEKLDSPVRKWLTYMALVVAAAVFMGDLIAALTTLLRGEITSRFLAKAFVVLVISGGVFFYYFAGVRKSDELRARGQLSRDPIMALVSAVTVLAMVILGFSYLGAPKKQRTLRGDNKRVQDLYQLSNQIDARWNSNNHKLPEHLDELSGVVLADPITRVTYGYHVKEGSQYELCATFSMENRGKDEVSRRSQWSHPPGNHCFALDATKTAENPYIYFPN
jgi:Domain of unknown function (DUF5671)